MMRSISSSRKCQFCCDVSRRNREDPLGSLIQFDAWIIIELNQPWKYTIWSESTPLSQTIIDLFQEIYQSQQLSLRPLAIALDSEYSNPQFVRVLNYSRPAGLFANYKKQEYLVPPNLLEDLIIALYQKPERLSHFELYRQTTEHIREIMVCTHGNIDAACARFGYPIYQQLRQNYATQSLRVWRCSHFGGHQFAPTLIDLPSGRAWGHLTSDILPKLVYHPESIDELRPFYRGCFALPSFAQIAEGEIWLQEGKSWFYYYKLGKILEINQEQTRAIVQVEFVSPTGNRKGTYQAIIEQTHQVMTQLQTNDEKLIASPQYQVKELHCL